MSKVITKVKTTVIESDVADADEFRAPSNYYIVNAFGQLVFVSARKRDTAQQWVDSEYGVGKYNIRVWKI